MLMRFFLFAVVLIGFCTLTAQETETITADLPVMITSCGQSPGATMLKVIFMKLKLQHQPKAYTINTMARAEDLKQTQEEGDSYKSLIIVMGASLKGMGAAGISIDDELDRIAKLIAEARALGITIIGAHIEGMKRRAQGANPGDNTDELSIDAVAPNSDILIVRKDGDADGRFTTIAQDMNIPMVRVEKNLDLFAEMKKIFTK
jgi:hypothetical protein